MAQAGRRASSRGTASTGPAITKTRWTYALHLLVGHHGVFSLTPIWLLAFAGIFCGSWKLGKKRRQLEREKQENATAAGGAISSPAGESAKPSPAETGCAAELPWFIAPLSLAVSVVVIGFYLMMSENYGGFAVGRAGSCGCRRCCCFVCCRSRTPWPAAVGCVPWLWFSWPCPLFRLSTPTGIPGGIRGFLTCWNGAAGSRIE